LTIVPRVAPLLSAGVRDALVFCVAVFRAVVAFWAVARRAAEPPLDPRLLRDDALDELRPDDLLFLFAAFAAGREERLLLVLCVATGRFLRLLTVWCYPGAFAR
jgi:hypothetical protein